MIRKLLCFIIVAFLLACNAYKGISTQGLSNGMTKELVEKSIGRKLTVVYSALENGSAKQEVFQAQKRIVRGGIARQQRYNFYFVDGKLTKYELADEKFSF